MLMTVAKKGLDSYLLKLTLRFRETEVNCDEEQSNGSAKPCELCQTDTAKKQNDGDHEHGDTDNQNVTDSTQDIADITVAMLNCIEAQQKDIERLTSESISQNNEIQSLRHEISVVKQAKEESSMLSDVQKYNQEVLEQTICSLQQQVNDQKFASYNGTMLWKITNFRQKQADAEAGRQLSIYSPAFYSSSTGYKMCCRLYPLGDGNAKNTHLSLFFVLMRGDYDDLLTFPFNFKVIFILYDQSGQRRHIVDSFRPDIKSNSFQKPQSTMNIASGIPKFFPLQMLQNDDTPYIQNDTIYIKTIVDFDGLSKAKLPYMTNMNMGLPDSLQKDLVRREMEKKIVTEEKSS